MLQELSRFENLGTPNIFYILLTAINTSSNPWTSNNIKEYFYNKRIDDISVFDGCIALAIEAGAIVVSANKQVSINDKLIKALHNQKYLSNQLLGLVLNKLKEDDGWYEIFNSGNISYDIIYKSIQIETRSFPFKYACIRKLLTNFNFIYPHPDKNIKKFLINPSYKLLFDRSILPEIRKRKIGIEELSTILSNNTTLGRQAEEFVLSYEKLRLADHSHLHDVEIISDYDIAAGYDITSFNSIDSSGHDRFIEVKSFKGVPNFHWSRNEIEVSRILQDRYFLYLIDRETCFADNYQPYIIQNPYESIIEHGTRWKKRIEGYFLTLISK